MGNLIAEHRLSRTVRQDDSMRRRGVMTSFRADVLNAVDSRGMSDAAIVSVLADVLPLRTTLTHLMHGVGIGAFLESLAEVMEESSAVAPERSTESLAWFRAALECEKTGRALCQALGVS